MLAKFKVPYMHNAHSSFRMAADYISEKQIIDYKGGPIKLNEFVGEY